MTDKEIIMKVLKDVIQCQVNEITDNYIETTYGFESIFEFDDEGNLLNARTYKSF